MKAFPSPKTPQSNRDNWIKTFRVGALGRGKNNRIFFHIFPGRGRLVFLGGYFIGGSTFVGGGFFEGKTFNFFLRGGFSIYLFFIPARGFFREGGF